jgi:hypothetical protein
VPPDLPPEVTGSDLLYLACGRRPRGRKATGGAAPLVRARPNKALQPTAYSLRFATLRSGFWQRLSASVRFLSHANIVWLKSRSYFEAE